MPVWLRIFGAFSLASTLALAYLQLQFIFQSSVTAIDLKGGVLLVAVIVLIDLLASAPMPNPVYADLANLKRDLLLDKTNIAYAARRFNAIMKGENYVDANGEFFAAEAAKLEEIFHRLSFVQMHGKPAIERADSILAMTKEQQNQLLEIK